MTLLEAAREVLGELGPLHYKRLTKEILSRKLCTSAGKTPAATVNSLLYVDIKRNGPKSRFARVGRGTYALQAAPSPGNQDASDDSRLNESHPVGSDRRVRTPIFPLYGEVRSLLRVWRGLPTKRITGLQTSINRLCGTPQNPMDWTNPDEWIQERLSGENRQLAERIWIESGKTVNPRHTYGHWLLCQTYKLIACNSAGVIHLTERGLDFIDCEYGETEAFLDEQEGIAKLLAIVAANGPARQSSFVAEWTEYLGSCSAYKTRSTIRDTLRRRLSNLLDRNLVRKVSTLYSITEKGFKYQKIPAVGEATKDLADKRLPELAQEHNGTVSAGARMALKRLHELTQEHNSLHELAQEYNASVLNGLCEVLLEMDPAPFEHLVKRLLEAMNYSDIEVTKRSGDGGVDIIAKIEHGITWVGEFIQAKRSRNLVQHNDLNALRDALYQFKAVRGTIITTSKFAQEAVDAAVDHGNVPITLIDGTRLINLLVKHGIGVKKRNLELLDVDKGALDQSVFDE